MYGDSLGEFSTTSYGVVGAERGKMSFGAQIPYPGHFSQNCQFWPGHFSQSKISESDLQLDEDCAYIAMFFKEKSSHQEWIYHSLQL